MDLKLRVVKVVRSNKNDFFRDFYILDCYSWAYEENNGFAIWI